MFYIKNVLYIPLCKKSRLIKINYDKKIIIIKYIGEKKDKIYKYKKEYRKCQ